jgi:hypothetical protein
MPSRKCREGNIVFVRARVLTAGSDYFQVRVEDHPRFAITLWAPAREIARLEDIPVMRALRREPDPAGC